jgi:hypothetical protein
MAIDLSNIMFSDQNDIVPLSGMEEIVNTGIANSLAGNDVITGNGGWNAGFWNTGTFNTDDGNDIITGINTNYYGIFNSAGTLGTGEGNDTITGIGYLGIFNGGRIDTGNGENSIICQGTLINHGEVFLGDNNDLLTANVDSLTGAYGIENYTIIDTGDGNDTITTTGGSIVNHNFMETGGGNDIITSTSFISNEGVIETGNGADSIISHESISNLGGVFLGEGNDSITAHTDGLSGHTLANRNAIIETGEGHDIITINGSIYNDGIINTGNGDDFIVVNATGREYDDIYNNGGAINMGNGNDSIIANKGFRSGPNSSGAWFLGEGDDYIKGFGSGDFYGGNGNDTLELTPGTYTVGIWGEGGESPIFTKGDQLMITSEFEQLKAGSIIYDFTSLTAGQIIIVV